MKIPLARVCAITGAPRSTIYHRRSRGDALGVRPGPKTEISDAELTERIRAVIRASSFSGEGHRKVRAHLRREHQLCVGKNRVLRLMRNAGLLAPQRVAKRRQPRVHDGRIITDAPNVRWGTDATMAWTRNDGWVWVFQSADEPCRPKQTGLSRVVDVIQADIAPRRGTPIKLYVADLDIRVLTEDGKLLRELTLDTTRIYQPRGKGRKK
jgi:hypothetical protein